MKEIIKHILFSIGIGFLLYQFQIIIESTYLLGFLKQNLITIVLALLAINTTTLGIVLTKIRELIDKYDNKNFKETKAQMLLSVNEQIVLVIIAILLFIISDSSWLAANQNFKMLIDVSCVSVFFYDLHILYDTSKSVFIIIDFKEK